MEGDPGLSGYGGIYQILLKHRKNEKPNKAGSKYKLNSPENILNINQIQYIRNPE